MAKDAKVLRTFKIEDRLWKAFDEYCKSKVISIDGFTHTPSKTEVLVNLIFALCEKAGFISKEDVVKEELMSLEKAESVIESSNDEEQVPHVE